MSRRSFLIGLAVALGAFSVAALAAVSPGSDTVEPKPVHARRPDVVLAQAAGNPAPVSTSQLPGGATSLQETYSDWIVRCSASGGLKICALSQQQTDSKSGHRILAVEVGAA